MPGITQKFVNGPETYEVNVAVVGGQLVEPDAATGKVKPCTAGSLKALGVALTDALPAGTNPVGTTSYGMYSLDISMPQPHVAVCTTGVVKMTFAANASWGDRLIAGATGQVTPVPAAAGAYAAAEINNTRGLIGICVDPAGVTAGNKGNVRLNLS